MRKRLAVIFTISAVILSIAILTIPAGADQPFMKAARTNCNQALAFLRRATADKGGHRNNSMRMINSAVSEINQGIAYDRRHDSVFDEEIFNPVNADQPNMIAAKDALKNARENLEKATDDKGGHRKLALKWVNDAIDEIQRGIEWDRNH